MARQEIDLSITNAQEALEENDTVDLLINNKISLEQMVGPLPERDFHVVQDIDEQKGRLEDIKDKYFGQADQTVEVEEKGLIGRMKDFVFGGTTEQVIEGTPGIMSGSQAMYNSFITDIKSIRDVMPGLQQGLLDLEDYIDNKVQTKQKLGETYFGLEDKLKVVQGVQEDLLERLDADDASVKQKMRINRELGKARKLESNIGLYMNTVAAKIKGFSESVQYHGTELELGQTYLNTIEIGLVDVETKLDQMNTSILWQEKKEGMIEAHSTLVGMADSIRDYLRKHGEYSAETNDVVIENMRSDPYKATFSPDEQQDRTARVQDAGNAYESMTKKLNDQARSILIQDRSGV